mgnify:CR=1 FL=1
MNLDELSSPRVRGKVSRLSMVGFLPGIIPAGAGKRHRGLAGRHRREDHPRGCGEKVTEMRSMCSVLGSSPRVRGKEKLSPEAATAKGIIPAGAGKRRAPQ